MNKTNHKIGVVGCATVGKSIISFLSKHYPSYTLAVTDQKDFSEIEKEFLNKHNVQWIPYTYISEFLKLQDYVFFSPGIDRTPFLEYKHKWVEEVDVFFKHCKKPVIAVTGSAGKTSTVSLLTHILNKQDIKAIACGNIGYPLLTALEQQDDVDFFITELSSFQLEYATACTPDYALVTSFAENHLDRHKTLDNYKNAKATIFKHQKNTQYACLPFELYAEFASVLEHQHVVLFSSTDNNYNINNKLSDITCISNWNAICTLLEMVSNVPPQEILEQYCQDFVLEHRVEYVRTYNNIRFYNDSKSTLPLSTLNALSYFKNEAVILLIGGFSKGVNRKSFIQNLPSQVKHIVCFGLEAEELGSYCKEFNRPYSITTSIKEAFDKSLEYSDKASIILFSPAGATHTHEFANYQERGNYFKSLVHNL